MLYNYLGFLKRLRIHLDVVGLKMSDPQEFAQNYELALRFKYALSSLAASASK